MANWRNSTMVGVSLFVLVPCGVMYLQRRSLSNSKAQNHIPRVTASNVKNAVSYMERIVQADEGKRGIKDIILPSGELYNAALEMVKSKRVAIITGFPCMMDYTPPTETDGPLGALSIAKTLLMLGKDVVIVTDECNEEVLLACTASAMGHKTLLPNGVTTGTLTMESFPASTQFGPEDEARLSELQGSVDLVVAIERAGPCQDGRYLTMRGYDMSHLVAPLELLLMPPGLMEEAERENPDLSQLGKAPRSIGIGWFAYIF